MSNDPFTEWFSLLSSADDVMVAIVDVQVHTLVLIRGRNEVGFLG